MIVKFLKKRLTYWPSTIAGLLIFVGFLWFNNGKLDFSQFTTYISLIATIVALLHGKKDSKVLSDPPQSP